MANRYNVRRRSLSGDSLYDHLRRPRRRSFERDVYSRGRRRSRDRSPEEIYSRVRRHSIEGPPSEYFHRGRRYSDEYARGYGRFRRYSGDFGPPRRYYSDEYLDRPRRYSFDNYVPLRRFRRYYSDPYIDQVRYGPPVVPVASRPAYTVITQPAYPRAVESPVVNYVRRPPPVEYVDRQVQYVERPIVQPVEYVERPIQQQVQYVERPVVKPVKYVRRPVMKQIEYAERPIIVEKPVVTRTVNRYQIDGKLTPIVTGPRTIHLKYDNVNTNYDVMPMDGVREITNYAPQPIREYTNYTNYSSQPITTGHSYTAYFLKKGDGQMMEESGYRYGSRDTWRPDKELDHILYHGNGKMTEVYESADFNNNKSRVLR